METHTTILSSPDPPFYFKGSAVSETNCDGNKLIDIRETELMNRNRKVHITGLESQNYFSFTMKSPDIRTKVMIDD